MKIEPTLAELLAGSSFDLEAGEWVDAPLEGIELAESRHRDANLAKLRAVAPTLDLHSRALDDGARRHGCQAWLADMRERAKNPRTKPVIPSSVFACIAGTWGHVMHELETSTTSVAPFRCRSWRCPRCGPAVNRREYMRLRTAVAKRDLSALSFLTLTFYRPNHRSPHQAARDSCAMWQSLLDRLRYELAARAGLFKRNGQPNPRAVELGYYLVFEQHRKADDRGEWMHAHVLVHNRELAEWIRRLGQLPPTFDVDRNCERQAWRFSSNVLAGLARRSGFGRVDAQPLDREGLAEYLTKRSAWCAAELGGGTAKGQVPTSAPRGFRRIRTSRRFLEPIERASKGLLAAVTSAPSGILRVLVERARIPWDFTREGELERLGALGREVWRKGWSIIDGELELEGWDPG